MLSVKERELPEADDDFAQIASQFDTIKELKDDLKTQVERKGLFAQAQEARDALVEKMLADLDMPLPQGVVDAEVNRHLDSFIEIFVRWVFHSAATFLPYSPFSISSASMLSNKALKLPSPKPSSPFR